MFKVVSLLFTMFTICFTIFLVFLLLNQGYFIKFQFFILGLEPSNKATILTNQKLGKRIKA